MTQCTTQLNSVHIFWQAGSGCGDIRHLITAMDGSPAVMKTVQDRVSLNMMLYIGICVGALIAGKRYHGYWRSLSPDCTYSFLGHEVSALYDNALPQWENDAMLHITSGVAIAFDCGNNTRAASAIAVSRNKRSRWWEIQSRIQHKLRRTLQLLDSKLECYEYEKPNGRTGHWWWKVDGTDWRILDDYHVLCEQEFTLPIGAFQCTL